MGYQNRFIACATVLALLIGVVNADSLETWKMVAIIVPSVVGGLTLLTVFCYCCCCANRAGGQGWNGGCGDCHECGACNCGNCEGCGGCMGCQGAGCQGGCCQGAGCQGGCCQGGCCQGGCDDCCGCCPRHPVPVQQTVYSSYQGPVQVQPVQKYRSAPPPAIGCNDPTYGVSLPVSQNPYGGGGVYGVGPMGGPQQPVYGGRSPY